MNQEPLDEMIRQAVDKVRLRSKIPLNEDQIIEQILHDPDLGLLMKGVRAHDRSGNLDDVYVRDIRRKVEKYLQETA